jgi:hypothetical protein
MPHITSDKPHVTWHFENTKDTPIAVPPEGAMARYRRMGYEPEDFYEHFSCFLGAKYIGRFLSLYECYRKTLGLPGHIAEVGVYKGAVTLFFAKLVILYETHAITQVHGFDSFGREAKAPEWEGTGYSYHEKYQRVKDLIEVQGLQSHALLHQLDAVTELNEFFQKNSRLQFKLVFLDVGDYEVVRSSIREFWPRMPTGGIMIFDQYNHEVAPGETRAARECLPPDAVIRTFPNGWMPTAYVVKER